MGKDKIDTIAEDLYRDLNGEVTINPVREQIENYIQILKKAFPTDSSRIGVALLRAYRIAEIKYDQEKWREIRKIGRQVGPHYDSIIGFYKLEQKKLCDVLLSTKDSNNIEVIREFFKAGVDSSSETRYKMAKRALQLKGVSTHDTGTYIYVLCNKKDELKRECEKYKSKEFNWEEINDDHAYILRNCGNCLENYVPDEEVLKYYLRAQELGSKIKYLEEPLDFSEDINKVKEKIKAKQQNKTGN